MILPGGFYRAFAGTYITEGDVRQSGNKMCTH